MMRKLSVVQVNLMFWEEISNEKVSIWRDFAWNKKIKDYSLNKMMCVGDGSGLLKVSSLITIKRSSGNFIWVYTVLDSARNPAWPSTARPVQPKNGSRFCETNNFFFISALNEMKFCTLVNQALDCTFFQDTKMQKSFFEYFFTHSQKFLGLKFPKKMVRIMYPGYQIHTAFYPQHFTILSLSTCLFTIFPVSMLYTLTLALHIS